MARALCSALRSIERSAEEGVHDSCEKLLPTDLPLKVQQKLLFQPETNPTAHVPLEDAEAFAFEPEAPAASRINAWWLADASWLAYCWNDFVAHARQEES